MGWMSESLLGDTERCLEQLLDGTCGPSDATGFLRSRGFKAPLDTPESSIFAPRKSASPGAGSRGAASRGGPNAAAAGPVSLPAQASTGAWARSHAYRCYQDGRLTR